MTHRELLQEGIQVLERAGVEEARLDAWLLLEYTTGCTKAYYYAHPEEPVPEEREKVYREYLEKRAARVPLQQITHQAFFMGYEFYVNEDVLIPRQDTETLVEEALVILKKTESPAVLDMCTGSGCILLSLLLECKDAVGTGVDLSEKALKVAAKNAENLLHGKRVRFCHSDLFGDPYFHGNGGKEIPSYDMIVSNPPYIETEEILGLMEEVRDHDPRMALDGGPDGLVFYRRITEEGKAFLKEGGWLLYEIGASQGAAVSEILRGSGFENVKIKKDLAGLDRVVLGQKKRMEESHV